MSTPQTPHLPANTSEVFAGWTTFPTRNAAEQFAAAVVEARLAACAQIDGPVTSHYIWEEKPHREEEWRVVVKFLPENAGAIEVLLRARHPYETPQWVVFAAAQVSRDYLEWMRHGISG